MPIDGLGQVYQKQGNTGAATWEAPIEQGQTPFAYVAQDLERKNLLDYQYNIAEKKAAEKQKADELAKAFDPKINEQSWVVDRQRELHNDLADYKKGLQDLFLQDLDPRDINNPKVRAVYDKQKAFEAKDLQSKDQQASFDQLTKLVLEDSKLDPDKQKFDHQKTFAALNAFRDAPSISERAKIDPKTLLVPKEQVFTTYDPIKDFKINDFGNQTGYDGPNGGAQMTILNEKGAKAALETKLLDSDGTVNAASKPHYEWGIEKGLWTSPKSYFDAQWGQVKPQFNTKFNPTYREPKEGYSITQLQGLSDADLTSNFKLGTGTAKIHSGEEKGSEGIMTLYNQTQLPDFKAVVSKQDAISAKTGKPIGGTGSVSIQSGNISTPLVSTAGKLLVLPKKGIYKFYNNSTKKDEEVTGNSEKEIADKLVSKGIAHYTPMVMGISEDESGKKTTVYVPANTALPNTGEKALKGVSAVHAATQTLADRMNEKAKSTAPQKPTQTYTIKGKKYTLKELEGMGYTKDQVIDFIDK